MGFIIINIDQGVVGFIIGFVSLDVLSDYASDRGTVDGTGAYSE